MQGPSLPFSDELDGEKYRAQGENFRDACYRVAAAVKDGDDHYRAFSDALLEQRFLTAGRIRSAMGSLREMTPYNCFVSGAIEDSLVEGDGSIMQRLVEAASTMCLGGGIGYDFSTLRPHGDIIKRQQTYTGGPVSFMQPYDAMCQTIESSGHQRGAQMAVLRIDHPDVELFINAKHPTRERAVLWEMVGKIDDPALRAVAHKALQSTLQLTAFNMSLAVTDEFMECLASGRPFTLKFGGQDYRQIDAGALWDMIMRSTWDWAEPGVLFIDTINRMNNLWYCETISATNPCAEQPLPPYGACLLGSFNLVKYLMPIGPAWAFDWDLFDADIPVVVRAMDNIVDRARYPLYEQKKEAQSKRRMGIGVTGLANCIEAMGESYGSPGFLAWEDKIMRRLTDGCYRASVELAREKGAFPMYDPLRYPAGQFIQTLDADVREAIAEYGIRNSHLTSIAPTGTISLTADNVSSGIEPVFSYSFDREVRMADEIRMERVEDYGMQVLGVEGRRSADVTVQQHLDVLSAAARHQDSAVAKTCNVGDDVGWDEFKQVYVSAWARGVKGCTTYRADGKRLGIFTVTEDDSGAGDADVVAHVKESAEGGAACYVDPTSGRRECD